MMLQCTQPALQAELLETTRKGDALGTAGAAHLAECDACQLEAERLRRIVSVWVADRPDDAIVAAAEMRFEARRETPPGLSWRDPIPFAAMGAVAALVLLVVARSGDTRGHRGAAAGQGSALAANPGSNPGGPAANGSSKGERGSAALGRPHVSSPRGVTPLADGVKVELKEGETAQVELSDGHTSVLRGPCSVEFWSSPTEVGGWRLAYQEGVASATLTLDPEPEGTRPPGASDRALPRGASVEGASKAASTTAHEEPAAEAIAAPHDNPAFEPAWARAAEALRRDDFDAADTAFAELGRASDAATRDAARLARAQLWMAHGRAAAVRPVLHDLATTGATALVRQRAAEFLTRNTP